MPGPAVLLGHMRATESDWHRRQDAQTTFPTLSPTSADLPIPHLHNNSRTVSATSSPLMSTRWLSETDNFILPPEPQAVKLEPLKTPDDGQEPKLELFDALHGSVDAALEIAPTSPRNAPSLRLPSFELLGIAARQSDRQVLDLGSSIAEVEAGSPIMAGQQKAATANPGEPSPKASFVGSPSPPSPPKSDSKATRDPSADIFRSPIHQRVTTITPPGESGSIDWSARVTVRLAGVDSPTDALEGDTTEPSQGIETETSGSNAGQPPAAQVATVIDPPQDIETWLSAAVETISKLKTSRISEHPSTDLRSFYRPRVQEQRRHIHQSSLPRAPLPLRNRPRLPQSHQSHSRSHATQLRHLDQRLPRGARPIPPLRHPDLTPDHARLIFQRSRLLQLQDLRQRRLHHRLPTRTHAHLAAPGRLARQPGRVHLRALHPTDLDPRIPQHVLHHDGDVVAARRPPGRARAHPRPSAVRLPDPRRRPHLHGPLPRPRPRPHHPPHERALPDLGRPAQPARTDGRRVGPPGFRPAGRPASLVVSGPQLAAAWRWQRGARAASSGRELCRRV